MGSALRVVEKMINQNAEDEIYSDFKFWEDESDKYRNGEGTLLPLWRFSTDRTKKKQVTALSWNGAHPDLFAVGYGSYDFLRQGTGLICCFSLKNTAHPEYTFSTESGVMSLHFHPQFHSLLAVGLYDGTVLVFDVRSPTNRPIYASNIKSGKHTDPVYEVFWDANDDSSAGSSQDLGFFSISSDGLVCNWVLAKNELKMEVIMTIRSTGQLS
jgi:dynein intermediate chain 1